MTISVTKPKTIYSTEMHIKKIDGKNLVDKYRDEYSDGTKSKWQKIDPPKEINIMREDYFKRIAERDGVPVSKIKKRFIPCKVKVFDKNRKELDR